MGTDKYCDVCEWVTEEARAVSLLPNECKLTSAITKVLVVARDTTIARVAARAERENLPPPAVAAVDGVMPRRCRRPLPDVIIFQIWPAMARCLSLFLSSGYPKKVTRF